MKAKYFIATCAALALGFTGCKNADEIQHAIYFTGAEVNPAIIYTIDGPQAVGLSISSSTPVAQTTNVHIAMAPELVQEYNDLYGTNYATLPADSYELTDDTLPINEGQSRSASGKFSITSLDNFQEGTTYCMPITITGTDNGTRILEASRTAYLIFNRTIITKGTRLENTHYDVPLFETDAMVEGMKQITFELRFNADSWAKQAGGQIANISSVMGIEEYFFLRFGDVTIDKSQLQLAGNVPGGKNYQITGKTKCALNKWTHIAVVYDGTQAILYVNGVVDGTITGERGTISLKTQTGRPFLIGYTPTYGRIFYAYISEARVWSRALSANELKNNECYVDPTSEGLIAYWRFNGNEESNGNVPDLTGHGFYARKLGSTPSYMPNVKCPE